jgi:AmiR/NasT family two-component response regulator
MCGVADNARDAVAGTGQSSPDPVPGDIELNGKPEGPEIGNFPGSKTGIPFMYITGQDNPETPEHAKKTVPNGCLLNPFDETGLKAALDRAHMNGEV